MSRRAMKHKLDLGALQSRGIPRLNWTELLTVTEGEIAPDESAAMTTYFSRFVPPQKDGGCVGCGERLTGSSDVSAFLLGATFTWGIQHGEGHCLACGYPARGIHYDVGPIKQVRLVLQYHPDELKPVRQEQNA
jgi:hypothetical protein